MTNGYIDLHVHSNFSDGKEDLETIINEAIKNNVSVLSFTEHYNVSSLKKAREIAGGKIEIIPGIEIGSSLLEYGISKKHVCHFTAYYINRKIYEVLDKYEIYRKKNIDKVIRKLNEHGIDITSGQVHRQSDKESIGRYDIAYTLFKRGYAVSPVHAYSKYLDKDCVGYVEREKMNPKELISTIKKCGGVPILAHPKSLKMTSTDFVKFISILKSYGLSGIEVYNPHNSLEKREELLELCDKFSLIPTVGSDFHSLNGNIKIGLGINENLKIDDYTIVEKIKLEKHLIDKKTNNYRRTLL